MKRGLCRAALVAAVGVGFLATVQPSAAATGDVLQQFTATANGFISAGGGRGVAFDGGTNLYYTFDGIPEIFKMTTGGIFAGSVPDAGGTIQGGPLAWDGTALGTTNYAIGNQFLYKVDPTTGNAQTSC